MSFMWQTVSLCKPAGITQNNLLVISDRVRLEQDGTEYQCILLLMNSTFHMSYSLKNCIVVGIRLSLQVRYVNCVCWLSLDL